MIAIGAEHIEEVARSVEWPVVSALYVPASASVPTVTVDDRAVGRMAGEYLLKCGYRRFAYYGVDGRWSHERFAGFQSALSRKHPPIVLNTIDDRSPWPSWPQACDPICAEQFLAKLTPPAAVFACDDIMARHVANACIARGLLVPGQIAILGTDNVAPFCESSDLTLSSVDPDLEGVGYEAASILDRIFGGGGRSCPMVTVKPCGVVTRRSTNPEAFEDPDVAAAVHLIREKACEGIDVSSICRSISISRRALERRFRKATGHTPGEEIHRIRMDRARELLVTTDLPVTDICVRCGYDLLSTFITTFRKSVGMTPRTYRVKHTKPQDCSRTVFVVL